MYTDVIVRTMEDAPPPKWQYQGAIGSGLSPFPSSSVHPTAKTLQTSGLPDGLPERDGRLLAPQQEPLARLAAAGLAAGSHAPPGTHMYA